MIREVLIGSAMVAAALSTAAARADYVIGAPIIIPSDNAIVTLEYLSAEAAYTGQLSFLGSGSETVVNSPATDTGLAGLGQQTYVNHTLDTGPIILEGTYNAGDVLHFAYRVFEPAGHEDLFRTDTATDVNNFAWDAGTGTLHIEDLRPGDPLYDADYNDIIVHVTFSSAPAPGSALALLAGGLIGLSRRRRMA